jgi:hypothetical protein
MKNIHVVSTPKPSRLYKHKFDETFRLLKNELQVSGQTISQNIYITSDEEIKEGDAYITKNGEICKSHNGSKIILFKTDKKIILTDNQDLISKTCVHNFVHIINDSFQCSKCKKQVLRSEITVSDTTEGVQAIPDDFLEWFVKNPNCEEVEVIKYEDNSSPMLIKDKTFHYKITIPKEEPKYPIGGYAPGYYMCNCSTCKKQFQGDKRAVQCEPCAIEMIKEEPKQELERGITITQVSKQETLEEATRKYLKNCKEAIHDNIMFIQGSNFGVKWQQERSYSKEEVKEQLNLILAMKNSLLDTFTDDNGFITDKWFEKFKKK